MLSLEINPLLEHILSSSDDISDINLSVGRPPQVEVNGHLQPVATRGMSRLTPWQTETIALHILANSREQITRLLKTGSVDLPYAIPGRTRFRVNIFQQRGTYSIVLRVIPQKVPTLADLNMPPVLGELCELRNGLVLVTGPTGSGKSTTLAAMINQINHEHAYHVVTIEDPVEFLHRHVRSTINQREVGADTPTFALALRAALRQAPKVVLVGEMRDRETIEIALEASETGHLVLSTLHTVDASKTVDRIIGVFPPEEQHTIRTRFAAAFRAVISQRLAARADGTGRTAILEILRSTMRTREYILKGEGEGRSLVDAMRDGTMDGMQHFDGEIERLVRAGVLTKAVGLSYATNHNNLALNLGDHEESEPALAGAGVSSESSPSAGGEKLPDWLE